MQPSEVWQLSMNALHELMSEGKDDNLLTFSDMASAQRFLMEARNE